MRTCSRCGQTKPLTDFHRKLQGYQPKCKPCASTEAKIRRERGGAEARREYLQAWHTAAKLKDPEGYNLERRVNVAKYRAKKKKASPSWEDCAHIQEAYEVAQVLSRGGVRFEVDHVVPINSKKVCGLHVTANLQILPSHLNKSKGNRWWPNMP